MTHSRAPAVAELDDRFIDYLGAHHDCDLEAALDDVVLPLLDFDWTPDEALAVINFLERLAEHLTSGTTHLSAKHPATLALAAYLEYLASRIWSGRGLAIRTHCLPPCPEDRHVHEDRQLDLPFTDPHILDLPF